MLIVDKVYSFSLNNLKLSDFKTFYCLVIHSVTLEADQHHRKNIFHNKLFEISLCWVQYKSTKILYENLVSRIFNIDHSYKFFSVPIKYKTIRSQCRFDCCFEIDVKFFVKSIYDKKGTFIFYTENDTIWLLTFIQWSIFLKIS